MRSMYSGVSSLRAHQVRMDVIGNNIANVNTVGYKASKVNFAEIYSQTVKGAGASTASRGGTNPQQVGLGMKIDSINVIHSNGATQRTDNATDIMIDGNGFFVVSPSKDAQMRYYTRAGNFQVDEKGYLVTSDGYFVLGKDNRPVQIDITGTNDAESTTIAAADRGTKNGVSVIGNINFNQEITDPNKNIFYTLNMDVYNSVGAVETVNLDFGPKITTPKNPDPASTDPQYSYRAIRYGRDVVQSDGSTVFEGIGTISEADIVTGAAGGAYDAANPTQNPIYARFDAAGNFDAIVSGLNVQKVQDGVDENGNPNMVLVTSATTDVGNEEQNIIYTKLGSGVTNIDYPLDKNVFQNLKHYAQETDMEGRTEKGHAAGNLKSYTIASNGKINVTYTNGQSEDKMQIALASFNNPAGLMKVGSNRFVESPNSGAAKLGVPASGSFGSLTPGALEMSNVDLSAEFTDMITTQRGFQANSRVNYFTHRFNT